MHSKKIRLLHDLQGLPEVDQDDVDSMNVVQSLQEDHNVLGGDDFMSLLDVHVSTSCDVKTTDSAITCPSDSAMMKTDIFDSSYDMPNMLSPGADDELGLLNGMDPGGALNIHPDNLDDSLQVTGDRDYVIQGNTLNMPGIFPLNVAPVGEAPLQVSLPIASSFPQAHTLPLTLFNPLASMDVNSGDCLQSAVMGNPVVLPNNGQVNGTLAQIAKIEPGADGKGYVLHLNIPSLTGSHMLSHQGLPLMAQNSRLVMANMAPLAPGVIPHVDVQSNEAAIPADVLADTGECVEIDVEGDCSPLPYDTEPVDTIEEQTESLCNGDVDISCSDEEQIKEEIEDDGLDEHAESLSPIDDDASQNSLTENDEQGYNDKGSTSTNSSYEDPDVERFVICSDGPMECVLCSFKTDSYSAFKSHIICSHPCWRITKKLSKNRLLVEKSVKMNVNIVQPTLPLAQLQKALVKKTEGDLIKSQKSNSQSTRRKQLIERNKRLFKCSKCWRLFVFEGSIVNHLLDYHLAKKPYDFIQVSNDHGQTFGLIHRCPYKNCFVSCASLEELQRHRGESHAQFVFRCQICGFTADSTEAVKDHASKIHHEQVMQFGMMD